MLLEALIAILIFSMGILAVVGLQGFSIKSAADAKYRADASFLANQVIGQMWVDRANLGSYTSPGYAKRDAWTTKVANTLPGGGGSVAVSSTATGSQVTVTVTWQPPGMSPHSYVTIAQIYGN